jgi:hypothetical protein
MAAILNKPPTIIGVIGLLGLMCITAIVGCAPRHGTTVIGPLPPTGARITVLHPADVGLRRGSSSAAEQYRYEGDFGEFTLETEGAALKVDGRDYGELPPGAEVVIDGRGLEIKVTVNAVDRKPAEEPARK